MLDKANAIASQITAWRREFHRQPEIGFKEVRTAARVAEVMELLGARVRTGVGRTGVVAELGEGTPILAIRADMDALPIQEANQVPYASEVPGMMHACGHDAHVAVALGVATLLSREKFPGCVRFLFQPSEEVADEEGISGAPRMVQDGAMQGVEMVLALHVDATTPFGKIRVGAGPSSGGVDSFFASIRGHGGHGARPHETIDPIYLTGHLILALNGIISRRIDPYHPAVVSLGSVSGGQAANVIPDQVELSGTIRYVDPAVQQQLHAEITQAFEITRNLGGSYDLKFEIGCPPMINAPSAVAMIQAAASALIGPDKVLPPVPGLGAEDFGSFSEIAPGAMFYLGCQIEEDPRFHHHPRFDIDERCLPLGAAILAEAALRFLSGEPAPIAARDE